MSKKTSNSGKNNKKKSFTKKGRGKRQDNKAASLAPVILAEMVGLNSHGEPLAVPAQWEDTRRRPPLILLAAGQFAPTEGDSMLVKIEAVKGQAHDYEGQVLKMLEKRAVRTVVGVYQQTKRGGLIEPVNRKQRESFFVDAGDKADAQSGEVVVAEIIPRSRNQQLGLACAKVTERLGDMQNPKCYSLIAIFNQDIPVDFPAAAVAEAEAAVDPVPEGREDLRDIPLITIDGADARDFDDAVFAEKDGDGWHILVAIADVAHYVAIDSALDKEAVERGNSTYFPDRVVPMLPEALSNNLCSLNPKVDRYCLAVHLWVNESGELTRHQFVRGIMRSHARLTYEQAQHQFDIKEGEALEYLKPLYGAYHCLLQQRADRGALELDLPEFQIQLGDDGHIEQVNKRNRLDSHKLIEECMVTANIAAGLTLDKKRLPGVYRVHDAPSDDKIDELRAFMQAMGFPLTAAPTVKDINKLLTKARGTPAEALISNAVLRSQMQALYMPSNLGHFGLGLSHYAHFTSPIRRYSDLITHRAIIAYIQPEFKEKMAIKPDQLASVAEHISQTERRSMLAEREANDRYITAFMADSGETQFTGTVTSVGNYGIFVTLSETGASGLVRMSDLGRDYYMYDEKLHCLLGRDTGQRFQLGQRVVITVKSADMQLGSLSFSLIRADDPPAMEIGAMTAPRAKKGGKPKHPPRGKKSSSKKGGAPQGGNDKGGKPASKSGPRRRKRK